MISPTQPNAKIPKAALATSPSDAKYFPLPKKFAGYKPGDSVCVKRDMKQHGYVKDFYTRPDQTRVYLVFAPSKDIPDLVLGAYPHMATVEQKDLWPPCINWKALPQDLKYAQYFQPSRSPPIPPDMRRCFPMCRWWDRRDLSNPSETSSYWPVPSSAWQPGHLVTVPASVLEPEGPRKLGRIEFISAHSQFADIIFPVDPARPYMRLRARVPIGHLLGPLIGTDLASVDWPSDPPKRLCPPSPPLVEVEANAVPEVVEPRTRVLSDPSTCLSSPPNKLRKTEHVVQDEPEQQVEPEQPEVLVKPEQPEVQEAEEDGPDQELMDVDQFLREDSPVY